MFGFKKEEKKSCPYCAETIKKEAKLCRYCKSKLPGFMSEIDETIKKLEDVVLEDIKEEKVSTASLLVAKKAMEAEIFINKGKKLFSKKKTPLEKVVILQSMFEKKDK